MSDFETVREFLEELKLPHETMCAQTFGRDPCDCRVSRLEASLAALNRLEIAADARAQRIAELEGNGAKFSEGEYKSRIECLSMFVRRLYRKLRKYEPEAEVIQQANTYLKAIGQAGTPFRAEEAAEPGHAPLTHALADAEQKATVKYEGILFATGCEYKKALLARHHINWPSPESADKFVRDVLDEPCHCDALRIRAEAAEKALAELRKHNADRNEATFERNAARDRSEP